MGKLTEIVPKLIIVIAYCVACKPVLTGYAVSEFEKLLIGKLIGPNIICASDLSGQLRFEPRTYFYFPNIEPLCNHKIKPKRQWFH